MIGVVDPFVVLAAVCLCLVVYGWGFTAGRNHQKRLARLIAQWSNPKDETGR